MLRFLSTLRTGLLAGARWVLQTLRTLWARFQPRSWRTWLWLPLGTVFSFGAVWIFFPSLGDFFYNAERSAGMLALIAGVVLAALTLAIVWINRRNARILLGVIGVVLATLLCPLTLLLYLMGGYGQYVPDGALGWPYWQTIALSEMYAFAFEALFLHLATRRALPLWKAALISFVINAASYVAGLIVFPFNAL